MFTLILMGLGGGAAVYIGMYAYYMADAKRCGETKWMVIYTIVFIASLIFFIAKCIEAW